MSANLKSYNIIKTVTVEYSIDRKPKWEERVWKLPSHYVIYYASKVSLKIVGGCQDTKFGPGGVVRVSSRFLDRIQG